MIIETLRLRKKATPTLCFTAPQLVEIRVRDIIPAGLVGDFMSNHDLERIRGELPVMDWNPDLTLCLEYSGMDEPYFKDAYKDRLVRRLCVKVEQLMRSGFFGSRLMVAISIPDRPVARFVLDAPVVT